MEISEEDLAAPQHLAFARERLLDLHDHVGTLEDLTRAVGDDRARRNIFVVAKTRADACGGLHQHLVTALDQFRHGGGREPDPKFVVLDLLGNADQHGGTFQASFCSARCLRNVTST
jgi:hypothetical protein